MMDPTGQVILVTGAARRVGRAIAIELAGAGFDVAIHYNRSSQAAQEVGRHVESIGRRATLVQGDLEESDTPARLVAETVGALGRLDVLVNNASVFEKHPLEQSSRDIWERVFRANVFAPAELIRAAAPLMRKAGQGRVINLTDIYADRPVPGYSAYCAAKAALANLTRSLALELAPEITVNAIAPGIAVFPEDYDRQTRERLIAQVPLKREGTPEGIAALARFLVTTGDYITGQIIPVDGGRSITP